MKIALQHEAKEILEKNLSFLEPWMQTVIQSVDQAEYEKRIHIEYSKENEPVCFYQKEDHQFRVNGQHPFNEAYQWYHGIQERGMGIVFLFGCGFGYQVFELFRNGLSHTKLVVFEQDEYLLRAMFSYFDMEELFVSHRVLFLAGKPEQYQAAFDRILHSMVLLNMTYPTLAFWLTSQRNFKKEYQPVFQYVMESLSLITFYVGNDHQDNLIGFCNMIDNARTSMQSVHIGSLKETYSGVPAFIIANGPSLDKNIEELKKIEGRGLIISVESAIRPLLQHGITPDILVVIERCKSTYEYHFKEMQYPKGIVLFSLAVADSRVFPSFSGEIVPIYRKYEKLNDWLNTYLGDGTGIDAGMNVSHLALEIALHLGAGPVIFVGQDYAYGKEGMTHSKASIYAQKGNEALDQSIHEISEVWVDGNDGTKILSNQLWVDFRMGLELKVAQHRNHTIWNATEGGAKIKGTICITLKDAIERFCDRPIEHSVEEIVQKAKEEIDPELRKQKLAELIQSIKEQAHVFRTFVVDTITGQMECLDTLKRCIPERYEENKESIEHTYCNNLEQFDKYVKSDIPRSFFQQSLFADYYLLNQLGRIDSREKIIKVLKIHQSIYHHINVISQSVSVTFEDAYNKLNQLMGNEPENELSIVIVTKNDEDRIGSCIDEIQELAQEIIVADLGSLDHTCAIAKSKNARIVSCMPEEGFSSVKNRAMEMASGRWILFLMPYEHIPKECYENLREALKNPNVEGYLLYLDYGILEYAIHAPEAMLRLIRNRSAYRFRYDSFEQIPDKILRNIEDIEVQIISRQTESMPWDLAKRIELVEMEAKQNKSEGYLQYMAGICMMNQQQFIKSRDYFQRAYELVNEEELYAPHLYKCFALTEMILEHDKEAKEILDAGKYHFPYYYDFWVLSAELYLQAGNHQEAAADLEICMDKTERPNYLVPGPELPFSLVLELLESTRGNEIFTDNSTKIEPNI